MILTSSWQADPDDASREWRVRGEFDVHRARRVDLLEMRELLPSGRHFYHSEVTLDAYHPDARETFLMLDSTRQARIAVSDTMSLREACRVSEQSWVEAPPAWENDRFEGYWLGPGERPWAGEDRS